MNKPKVAAEEYIQFLVASPVAVSGTEAARVHAGSAVAHDAYTRLLHRLEPDAASLWQEAQGLVTRHWSGKHHAVVSSINLLTLLWSDGRALVPVDYRFYDKETDEPIKNDHLQHLLHVAQQRGFAPRCVLFDSWYASLANLRQVRACGWAWLTRLKRSRLVNPDGQGLKPLSAYPIGSDGQTVWFKGHGANRVFRLAAPDGGADGAEYWASSQAQLSEAERAQLAALSWGVEQYHRGLKQCCGVKKARVRAAKAQRNHIGCALRAFLRLKTQRPRTGSSWYGAKKQLLRDAVRTYLASPLYILHSPTA